MVLKFSTHDCTNWNIVQIFIKRGFSLIFQLQREMILVEPGTPKKIQFDVYIKSKNEVICFFLDAIHSTDAHYPTYKLLVYFPC